MLTRHGRADIAGDHFARAPQRGYAGVLRRLGARYRIRGIWLVVGEGTDTQGWKLHLSSTPRRAIELLESVVPLLLSCGVPFKIARNQPTLAALNSAEHGETQVGKFVTVYPRGDDESRSLATALRALTRTLDGPVVPSDLRLGEVVYARYGAYTPIIRRNRLGIPEMFIFAPNGSLRRDGYAVPFVPPPDVNVPFAKDTIIDEPRPENGDGIRRVQTVGPGYRVLGVLRANVTGSIFLGLDLQSQDDVALKAIKQARQHCHSDVWGRDTRDRLRNAAEAHDALRTLACIPKADPYFEWNKNGYLPLEYVPGETVESFVIRTLSGRSWSQTGVADRLVICRYAAQLVDAVSAVHERGFVHRDIAASNVWIGRNGRLYLLDLELAHLIRSKTPPFTLGTPGFMSPNQEGRRRPMVEDDVYAVGCALILMLTGLDPRRVLFGGVRDLCQRLQCVTGGLGAALLKAVSACVDPQPSRRPPLGAVRAAIEAECRRIEAAPRRSGMRRRSRPPRAPRRDSGVTREELRRFISGGITGLMRGVARDSRSGLWLSQSIDHSHGHRLHAVDYELRRDTNRGVAGVIYVLARLARWGYSHAAVKRRVRDAIAWLTENRDTSEDALPGLHFGRAGHALCVAEAVRGGFLRRDDVSPSWMSNALSGDLDWPDITHGAAGQGVAALYCADAMGWPELAELSHRCSRYLLDAQSSDGSWKMPEGVEGMSGETLTGFAHGVAGIVYFLAQHGWRFPDAEVHAAWTRAADWLERQAVPGTDGNWLWPYSDRHKQQWRWWCHGSPGIALTFLHLFEVTGEERWRLTANRTLRVHPVQIRHGNLSQCHGLSGLGEIYLEAYRVLGDSEWIERATAVADQLIALRRELDRTCITWLVEEPHGPTADLMVGSGGVIHFLLRLELARSEKSKAGRNPGFPLLLDP
jgi:serine/threonine protein kinase